MRYVIIRDDDTNALTPPDCLERLYRPFLRRGLPVNLAVIPNVSTQAVMANGQTEGFLAFRNETSQQTVPIQTNRELVQYLGANPGFKIVQHGCYHDYLEFERVTGEEAGLRLDQGRRLLMEAGFSRPETFVAPYDKFSPSSYRAAARRFDVLSTGWFELRRLPFSWWPRYLLKKITGQPHWCVGRTVLMSHPGCLLSCHRKCDAMLDGVIRNISTNRLTVLVTHWWEYFRNGKADQEFIGFLHQTAEYLSGHPDIQVISFADVAANRLHLD